MTTLAPQNSTLDDDGFPDTYDQEGAMQYIVSTVLVYALLGVCSMLCARIKRKRNEAAPVASYASFVCTELLQLVVAVLLSDIINGAIKSYI